MVRLLAVGDQAPFVEDAVRSVMREGVLAAGLTGLMILVFLGSWRSTVIIIISIPLAILTSVALLAATGENINVMTMGGLALAVGILVDDATVTIENINYQLEQKKEIEAAIMDGARQIVIPATVSLLCISIVFVPMFSLGGVSGYLFRPMAKAVVFALMGSYLLSRTLVPTMANYLLAGHAHDPDAEPRTIFGRFQHGFERYFEATRQGYSRILSAAMRSRLVFVSGFLTFALASLVLVPFLGQNFFPDVETVQIRLHVRGPTGLRIEETGKLFTRIEDTIRDTAGAKAVASMVDNIGLPISGTNLAYSNSGTIGSQDGDILITLQKGREKKTEELIKTLREKLPILFPGVAFSFLPADIVTQILNFGLPAPIDVQVVGKDRGGQSRPRRQNSEKASVHHRNCGCAHSAAGRPADHQCRRRSGPREQARTDRGRHHPFPADHACRFDPDSAPVLAGPQERRLPSSRDPDAAILDDLAAAISRAFQPRPENRRSFSAP